MTTYDVKLHYGPYNHVERVLGAEDPEQAIAIAWRRVERKGLLTLGMAATGATATEISESDEGD